MAGATFADVERIGCELPEVRSGTWYGTPGLDVRGKGSCRMWSEREYRRDGVDGTEVLVVMCDADEKSALIEASGGVLLSTPHTRGTARCSSAWPTSSSTISPTTSRTPTG